MLETCVVIPDEAVVNSCKSVYNSSKSKLKSKPINETSD